ncbi:MAG TPA: polysaccharide deacetylase family protein [Gemmatimonadales bacterium]|nr:polysaccharide deacetylase family protein [Gemmatimonadales bacterium]
MSQDVAGFCFHEVTDDPRSTGFQRRGAAPFRLTPRAFNDHLEAIASSPWSPCRVAELDRDAAARHLLLTFDDGGRSALDAADELSRRGWQGHFFIVTSRIGTSTFLDAAGIRYLHGCGHVIGSHSHTHPDIFRELSPAAMLAEWRTSAGLIADLLGAPCETASVPGGEISPAVLETGAAAGFRFLFTVEPRLRPWMVRDCRVFGRYMVKQGTPPSRVGQLARFRGWTGALAARRLKAVARRSVPPLYRYVVSQRAREAF